MSFLLQYHRIEPGKCFYIRPKIAHAYIKGECLEIMKSSDNVVRLGLTGKLKDVETMMNILEFDPKLNKLDEVA